MRSPEAGGLEDCAAPPLSPACEAMPHAQTFRAGTVQLAKMLSERLSQGTRLPPCPPFHQAGVAPSGRRRRCAGKSSSAMIVKGRGSGALFTLSIFRMMS